MMSEEKHSLNDLIEKRDYWLQVFEMAREDDDEDEAYEATIAVELYEGFIKEVRLHLLLTWDTKMNTSRDPEAKLLERNDV
jgi:hypothetical protein